MILAIHPELATMFYGIKTEDEGLRAQLLEAGKARDKIKVWRHNGETYIIDGHRRYKICTEHNLGFETEELEFPDITAAKAWMANEQLSRRNVPPLHQSKLRLRYMEQRQGEGATSADIAAELGVNRTTLHRDKILRKTIDSLPDDVQQAALELEAGRKDYDELSNLTEDQQREVLIQVKEHGNWEALHGKVEPRLRKHKKQKAPGVTLLDVCEQHLGAMQRNLDGVLDQSPECEMLHKDIYGHVESILHTIEEWRKAIQ